MTADERTQVIVVGLGPIGKRCANRLLEHEGLRVVGAADIDPSFHGKDLGEVLERPERISVKVSEGIDALPNGPGVAILATASRLNVVAEQVISLASKGWNVLSTSEELTFPLPMEGGFATKLDQIARDQGVSVLGTGINPGFLLDTLVLSLRYACVRVDAVHVERKVDTNHRRAALQAKVGVGMTKAEFEEGAQFGKIGHVGLAQSAHLLADGLGWQIDGYTEDLEPVLAETRTQTGLGMVEPGRVIGQHQHAVARVANRTAIDYQLWMYSGCEGVDRITIKGEPNLSQVIEGGINGDIGTEAVVSNLVGQMSAAEPGLLTMSRLARLC